MKRYFTFPTAPDPSFAPRGGYHYMSLPQSGFVAVLMEESADPPDATWTELPHLLENTPAYFDGIQHVLGSATTTTATSTVTTATLATPTTTVDTPAVSATIPGQAAPPVSAPSVKNSAGVQPIAGIQVTHTTFQIAKALAAINSHFRP